MYGREIFFMEMLENKGVSWIVALCIAAAVTLLALLSAQGLRALGQAPAGTVTQLPCSPSQVIEPLGDGVIYSDGTHLHALGSDARQKWNYMVGVGFSFDASKDGVAAWTGSSVALLDDESGKSLFSGVMNDTVISAVMGEKYAAVLIGADEQNSTLVIMEHGGREIDRITLPNVMVIEYGFFNNGNMLWVMSLDTEGTIPMSQITTYRPGRMKSGHITDSDQVLYRVMFESPDVYTVGTTYIKTYDYTGVENVAKRRLIYGWYLMDTDGSGTNALMAYVPMSQVGMDVSVSDVRLISGDKEKTVRMPFACYALDVVGNKVYGFSEQYVMSIGLNDSKASVSPLPMKCDDLLGITDGRQAILTSEGSVYLVTLP